MTVIDTDFEQSLIEAIGQGLPLVKKPYQQLARQLGCTESLVIEGISRLCQRGDIKRFGVVVRHRNLGYKANGMVVWDISDERIAEVGHCLGQYEFVTLCYQRPRQLPDWPYNLFCMIHGKDRSEVRQQVELIIQQCNLGDVDYDILFSKRCFKQRGAHYSRQLEQVSNG